MYQSVFVIAEEKNECIIATEVSLFFMTFIVNKEQFLFYYFKYDFIFIFFFRYNKEKILFTVNIGSLVDCLQVWRGWDLFKCKLLLLKT